MVPGTLGAIDLCPETPVRPELPAGANCCEIRLGCAVTAGR